MSVLQSQAVSANSVKIRFEEQYVSAGLNYKLLKSIGRGIITGFICQPGLAGALWLDIVGDPVSGVSAACLEVSAAGSYAMHVVLQQTYSFNLAAQASSTVYVVVDVQYSTGAVTAGQIKVVDAAELALNPQFVILSKIVVPASGPIPAANINWGYGTYSGDNLANFVPPKLNLLHNGSFERDHLASAQPSGWSLVPSTTTISVDNAQAHTGTQSLKITSASTATAYAYSGMLAVDPASTYFASAWMISSVSSPIVGTGVQLYVQFYTEQSATVGSPVAIESPWVGGSATWAQVKGIVTAPSTAAYARLYVEYIASAGTIWVDDFEFATRNTAHQALKSNRQNLGGVQLPMDLFPLLEEPSAQPLNSKVRLQFADWTAGHTQLMLQFVGAAMASDFNPQASGNGVGLYNGQGGLWGTHSTGSVQVGGLESGDILMAQLHSSGGQGYLTLGKTGPLSLSLSYDILNTLANGGDATSLHYHTGASLHYAGGAAWLSGVANPAATVDAMFDHIVSVLGSIVATSSGARAIGVEAISGAFVASPAGDLYDALVNLVGDINSDAAFLAQANTFTQTQTVDVSAGTGFARVAIPNDTSGSNSDAGLVHPPTSKTVGTPDSDFTLKEFFDTRIQSWRRWDAASGLWTHTPIVANNAQCQATVSGINLFGLNTVTVKTGAGATSITNFPLQGFFYVQDTGGRWHEVHYTGITVGSPNSSFSGCTGVTASAPIAGLQTFFANPLGYQLDWYGATNPWQDLTGVAPGSIAIPFVFWKDNDGVVHLQGGSGPQGGSSAYVLNSPMTGGFRPASGVIWSCATGQIVSIDPVTGYIQANNTTFNIFWDGLSYRTA